MTGYTAALLATALGVAGALVHPLAPLLVPLGAALVVMACSSAFALLVVFMAVLFLRPADFFPELASLPLAEIAAIAALSALVLSKLVRRDFGLAMSPANRWVVLLTVGVVVSCFFSTNPTASFDFLQSTFVKILALWLLILNIVDTKKRIVVMQGAISILTGLLGAYAIWAKTNQVALVEDTRAAFVGVLGDPNDLAFTLLVGLPFAFEAFRTLRINGLRWLFLLAGVLATGGIIVTQSRGGLMGLAVCMYFWMRTFGIRREAVLAVTIAGAIAAVLLGGISERKTVTRGAFAIDDSSQGRIDAWYAGVRMAKHNPLWGVGLDRATDNFGRYAVNPVSWRPKTSHNMFVQAGAETGLLGFIPFMLLIGFSLRTSLRLRGQLRQDSPDWERTFIRAQFPNLVAILVAGFFLSVAWSWFLYILLAQSAASERTWL
jgi:putative inorganic carbon (hco3(-)) transporter